jgi:hypothetical protein
MINELKAKMWGLGQMAWMQPEQQQTPQQETQPNQTAWTSLQ